MKEWVAFWNYVAKALPNRPAKQLWASIFKFKKLEFPNLCLLAELIIAISGSSGRTIVQSAYTYAV